MVERGIPIEQIKTAVNYADHSHKEWRGNHGGWVFRFNKVFDGERLAVVAEVQGSEAWLVTAYWVDA